MAPSDGGLPVWVVLSHPLMEAILSSCALVQRCLRVLAKNHSTVRPAMSKKDQRKSRKRGKQISKLFSGLTDLRVGFPDRFRVTMPYGTYQLLVPGAGSISTYTFRGNSVFDPDFAVGGTTADCYTQLSTLYNRYRVLSSRIHVHASNTGTVPVTNFIVAGIVNSPGNAVQQLQARHMAQGTCAPGGPVSWTHAATATTHKIFGVPKAQVLAEDDFAGLVGGNPNNVWYWHISTYNLGGVAGAVNLQVRIEYEVVWSMPLALAP